MQREGTGDEQAAVALLGQRGLNDAALTEAEGVLAQVQTAPQPAAVPIDPVDPEVAQQAMWPWYLEWSMIARTAIRNGTPPRALGFLRRGSAVESDEEIDVEVDDIEVQDTATIRAEVA